MVEVLDAATAAVLPGYGARDCIIQNQDGSRLPLVWGHGGEARDTAALAGRTVQLRFTTRDAAVYSVGV